MPTLETIMKNVVVTEALGGALISVLLRAGAARPQPSAQPASNAPRPALDNSEQPGASGQSGNDQSANLTRKLRNPIASLISVPSQDNFDYGGGTEGHGSQYTINIQPVIPFKLTSDWNLIVRTIVPITTSVHSLPKSAASPTSCKAFSLHPPSRSAV
jgi:hypothetical protein